jgi:hypothetical protein
MEIIATFKEIAPEVLLFIITAIFGWIAMQFKKIATSMKQIPEIRKDIRHIKKTEMVYVDRINAQDVATVQIFSALKSGKVNGEAEKAIKIMAAARERSDAYMRKLYAEDTDDDDDIDMKNILKAVHEAAN